MIPTLEVLEDRTLPAVAMMGPVILPPPVYAPPAQPGVANFAIVVPANSSTTADLDGILGGRQTALVGNSNPGLVKSSLSDGELTIKVAPGKLGAATLTVGVINGDGSSVRETIVVTVLP